MEATLAKELLSQWAAPAWAVTTLLLVYIAVRITRFTVRIDAMEKKQKEDDAEVRQLIADVKKEGAKLIAKTETTLTEIFRQLRSLTNNVNHKFESMREAVGKIKGHLGINGS